MPRSQKAVAKLKVAKKQERKQAVKSNGQVIEMLAAAAKGLEWYEADELGEFMEIGGKTAQERLTPFTEKHIRRVTYEGGQVRWIEFPVLVSRRVDETVEPNIYLFAHINLDSAVEVKPRHISEDDYNDAIGTLLECQSDTRATSKQIAKLEAEAATE